MVHLQIGYKGATVDLLSFLFWFVLYYRGHTRPFPKTPKRRLLMKSFTSLPCFVAIPAVLCLNACEIDLNIDKSEVESDSEVTEIIIEDDGKGFSRDLLSRIGEPYLKSNNLSEKSKSGLGLGLFIGKTLLEKNFASVNCRNSKTRSGAEIIIKWNNKDLFNI